MSSLHELLSAPLSIEIAKEFGFDLNFVKNLVEETSSTNESVSQSEWIDFSTLCFPATVARAHQLLDSLAPLAENTEQDDEWGDYAHVVPKSSREEIPSVDIIKAKSELLNLLANHPEVSSDIVTDKIRFDQSCSVLQQCFSDCSLEYAFVALDNLVKKTDLVGNYEQLVDLFSLIATVMTISQTNKVSQSAVRILAILSRRLPLVQSRNVVSRCIRLFEEIRNDPRAIRAIAKSDPNLLCLERWGSCEFIRNFKI